MRVVSITWGRYRVDATVNKENLLQRIHTWVPSETLGDMNYEHEFPNASYVTVGRHRVSDRLALAPGVGRQLRRAGRHLRPQRVRRNAQGRAGRTCVRIRSTVPDAVASATFPDARRGRRRWPTVCICMAGGTHNSVAVEFATFIVVYRRAAQRGAEPCGHRGDRPPDSRTSRSVSSSTRTSTSTTPAACAPTTTSARHDHAVEELRLPQSRRDQLRAEDAAARHGVALAADGAGRGLLLRDRSGRTTSSPTARGRCRCTT